MNVLATQYSLSDKSLDIFVSGCNGSPRCKGCHNPLSWDFNAGDKYTTEYSKSIARKVCDFSSMIENVRVMGGEPLDQNHDELKELLKDLKSLNLTVWLFTRYNFGEIPSFVFDYCDYVKTGKYIPELSTEENIMYGVKLATTNQYIYKRGTDYRLKEVLNDKQRISTNSECERRREGFNHTSVESNQNECGVRFSFSC